jgi:hypothetical protein
MHNPGWTLGKAQPGICKKRPKWRRGGSYRFTLRFNYILIIGNDLNKFILMGTFPAEWGGDINHCQVIFKILFCRYTSAGVTKKGEYLK